MSLQDSHQISDVKVMLIKGADGKGITNIEKTGEEGLSDIYTITYSDGTKTTFTVTNGASGGMSAQIFITSDAGSVVSVTSPSGRSLPVEQIAGQTTLWRCESTEYGVHTIDSILGSDDAQATVDIDTCKIYSVDDSHNAGSITVVFPEGATCSCAKGAETPVYATTNPYTFDLYSFGTYTITCELNGVIKTQDVVISTAGQSETVDMTRYTLTINVYSAVSDTLSYTDADGNSQTITTDSTGLASGVTVVVDRFSPTVFTSSVAKDITNGSSDFSKSIEFSNDTQSIYVMPDGDVLYWYGNKMGHTFSYSDFVLSSNAGTHGSTSYSESTNNIYLKSPRYNSGSALSCVEKKMTISNIVTGSGKTKCNFRFKMKAGGSSGADSYSRPYYWNGNSQIDTNKTNTTTLTYYSYQGNYSDSNNNVSFSGASGLGYPTNTVNYGETYVYAVWLS